MNETQAIAQAYPGFIPDGKGGYHKPKAGGQRSVAESQHSVGDAPREADQAEAPYTGRCVVRITRIGNRLLDKDNLYGGIKFHCDSLRYYGLIRDDNPQAIDLEVYQDTIENRGGVARTEIEVTLIPFDIIH